MCCGGVLGLSGYSGARSVLEGARRVRVVSHHDLDGVASAALLVRWARSRGVEARYRLVSVSVAYKTLLGEVRAAASDSSVVVAADISPRGRGDAEALASALRWGQRLVWLDHHVWDPATVRVLEDAGAVIVVDRSKVTAEIACRVIGCQDDVFAKTIMEAARADDSCTSDHLGLAPKWRLVLRILGPREARRAVEALARGELWPGWADELYRMHAPGYYDEIRSKTTVNTYTFNGVRVVVVTPPPTANACDVETILGRPENADVMVLLYPKGISIRSLGPYRADCIAARLGGGGHPRAAGAKRPSTTMGPAQIARIIANAAKECTENKEGT